MVRLLALPQYTRMVIYVHKQQPGGKPVTNRTILKKTETKYMSRMPQAEVTKALKELSSGAYRLLTYYYSRNDGWVFNDINIANTLGSSERQVKRYRKELLDEGYLLIHKGQTDVYFIGQGAVTKFMEAPEYDPNDELPKEPLVTKGSCNE